MTHQDFRDRWTDAPKADSTELDALIPDYPMADLNATAADLSGHWQRQPEGNQKRAWSRVDAILSGKTASANGARSGENSVGWNSVGWNSLGWNSVGWNSLGWNSVGWNSLGWNRVRRVASIAAVAVLTVGVAAAAMPLLGGSSSPASEPHFATAFHGITADTDRSLADGVITLDEIGSLEAQAQTLLDQVAQDPQALERLAPAERATLLEALDSVETQLAQASGFAAVGPAGIAGAGSAGTTTGAISPSTGTTADAETPLAIASPVLAALRGALQEAQGFVPATPADAIGFDEFAPDLPVSAPSGAAPTSATPAVPGSPGAAALPAIPAVPATPAGPIGAASPSVPVDLSHVPVESGVAPGKGEGQATGIGNGSADNGHADVANANNGHADDGNANNANANNGPADVGHEDAGNSGSGNANHGVGDDGAANNGNGTADDGNSGSGNANSDHADAGQADAGHADDGVTDDGTAGSGTSAGAENASPNGVGDGDSASAGGNDPVPATPATPVVPATPATPVVPATPATPVVPATPATPVVPATPATRR